MPTCLESKIQIVIEADDTYRGLSSLYSSKTNIKGYYINI